MAADEAGPVLPSAGSEEQPRNDVRASSPNEGETGMTVEEQVQSSVNRLTMASPHGERGIARIGARRVLRARSELGLSGKRSPWKERREPYASIGEQGLVDGDRRLGAVGRGQHDLVRH